MTQDDVVALVFTGLFLFVPLGALIRHELSPQAKVTGKVVRFWREGTINPYIRHYHPCFVEIEREGYRSAYSCDPCYFEKLEVGQLVRLHLKGKYVEYLRVLAEAEGEA